MQKSDIKTGKFGNNSKRGGRGNGRGKGSGNFKGGADSDSNKKEGGNATLTKSTPIEPEISKQKGGEASSPADDGLNNEVEISDSEMAEIFLQAMMPCYSKVNGLKHLPFQKPLNLMLLQDGPLMIIAKK